MFRNQKQIWQKSYKNRFNVRFRSIVSANELIEKTLQLSLNYFVSLPFLISLFQNFFNMARGRKFGTMNKLNFLNRFFNQLLHGNKNGFAPTQRTFCTRSEILYFLQKLILRFKNFVLDVDNNLKFADVKIGFEIEVIKSQKKLEKQNFRFEIRYEKSFVKL